MKQKKKVFVSSWKTDNTSAGSSTSTQVKLPLESAGTYNFSVKWGDESTDTITAWDQSEVTHTYASAGTYPITIKGQCEGWAFDGTGDRLKLLDISSWGRKFKLGNASGYFRGAENFNITAVDVPNLSGTTTFQNIFLGATVFNSSNVVRWDVSGVTNMINAFNLAIAFNQPIGVWNVGNVLTMQNMLQEAAAFNQNIGTWNVSNVTDMVNMLKLAIVFNQPIGTWDVSSLVTASNMFQNASAFNQPIGAWDVSSLANAAGMLRGTPFDQDIGAWPITSMTNAASMLLGTTLSTANYNSLLTGWEAQAVQNNVSFHGGNATYSAGAPATARANLLADHTWTIADGGLE